MKNQIKTFFNFGNKTKVQIKPQSQTHEVLLILLENYPNRVNVWTLMHATQSLNLTSVISHLRKRLKHVLMHEIGEANLTDPIVNIQVDAENKYNKPSSHTFYVLDPRYKAAATILEQKIRNEKKN